MLSRLWVLAIAACGGDSGGTSPGGQPSPLVFNSIHWRMENDGGGRIDKSAFTGMVASAFGSLRVRTLKIEKATVSGELSVREGQGALALEMRVDTERLFFPLTVTLAATATVDKAHAPDALVKKGLGDLASATREMIRVAEGDRSSWIKALQSPEPDVQILGARLLGMSRVKHAVPALAKLLTDPREPVAEAAAESLTRIGDERAVPLLIQSIRRGDIRDEVRVIEAIGRIGGPEAQAYLEMTAIGHELTEVRHISKELLERLRKAKKHP